MPPINDYAGASANTLQEPRHILFLTRSLERGGAERQLTVLAKGLARRNWSVCIAVFYGGGTYESELALAGVRILNLNKRSRWDIPAFMFRLIQLRVECPHILHAYLCVPNILAVLLKPLLPHTRIVWGIRASDMDLSRYDWLSRLSYRLEACLARWADLILANSSAGRQHAVSHGFPQEKIHVIANGIDTENFRYCRVGRETVRSEWGIRDEEILIGLIARLDPMKDHPTFLSAAAIASERYGNARFVCVGGGHPSYLTELMASASAMGLSGKLIWAGTRDDLPSVYSAMDIVCSSSAFGEGFSNAIAEAMSCERPCVVTDVGDSARIVGETGRVVPRRDPSALADGWSQLIDLSEDRRITLGLAARQRVETEFSVDTLVSRTVQELSLQKCA